MEGTRQQLARLHADFPDWIFQHLSQADQPWEARRRPSMLPSAGGVAWIVGRSAERLRELVGGIRQIEAQLEAEEAGRP